ncbi:MAG: DUF1552 domain-containing protein [Myxococcota bacterium]
MNNNMNRRIFLRGLGGAAVAAPFLSSVWERQAWGQSATRPKTFIAMFTHYGCITTRWFPKKSHGALTSEDLNATSLKPLAQYVNKILMPRGIRGHNEWTSGMVRGQGNDPHTQVVGSYFTCQPVTPNSDDPFDFDQAKKFNAKPKGPSLDHVMAQQLSSNGTPMFMRVGNSTDTPLSGISYSAAETQYPGLTLSQAFSGITGLFKAGTPMTPDTYQAVKGKSIIDLVRDDLDTLARFDMSQADKMKLEAWKALLNQTTQVMTSAVCNQALGDMIGASQSNVTAAGKSSLGADILTTMVANGLDGADVYSAVAALAAACAYNPVIFLKYPGSYVFKGLNINTEAHALSHRLDNAGMSGPCLPNAVANLIKIDTYYAQKFANLVGMLNNIKEGDGSTLLDNCAAVWFQEMSDGNAHNLNNLPIIQAGSCGGYFKTGWAVNVDDGSATLTVGNSESQCTDGTPNMSNGLNQGTGTDAKLSKAPLNKYFYNIMNAMGVKAGDDGFPKKGGTAPVSKFGMYDKTEDYIHGGTNPARITSPGEYTALKANG